MSCCLQPSVENPKTWSLSCEICLFTCQNYNFIPKLSIFTTEKNIMSHVNRTFFTFFISLFQVNGFIHLCKNFSINIFTCDSLTLICVLGFFFTRRNKTMQTKSHNCTSSHLNFHMFSYGKKKFSGKSKISHVKWVFSVTFLDVWKNVSKRFFLCPASRYW